MFIINHRREIFTKENIIDYIEYLFLFMLVLTLTIGYSLYNSYNYKINGYNDSVTTIIDTDGLDLSLMCNITNCQYLKYDGVVYKNNGGYLDYYNKDINTKLLYGNINTNYDTIIKYATHDANITMVLNNSEYFKNIFKSVYMVYLTIIIGFTIYYLKYTATKIENDILYKSSFRKELEGKLQRTMTESAHHEMLMPLALIKTLFNDFIKKLYPCKHTENKICDLKNKNHPFCNNCPVLKYKRNIDGVAEDYFDKINIGIERLEAVLNQMAETKHLKYSNGDRSILEIVVNAVSGANTFSLSKIDVVYENKELMAEYSVRPPLTNGDLLNIINNHVNNSIEARSTTIKFTCSINTAKTLLYLHIADNGHGILNENGKIIKTNKIFNSGYTNKDIDNNTVILGKKDNRFKRLYSIISKAFSSEESSGVGPHINKSRGVGLYINKSILIRSNGGVDLVHTSDRGTVFKLTIPVKEKRK